jgi:acryloyl-coenzyme A reductase
MRAVVVREPGAAAEVMRVETVPDPAPGPRDLIIEVAACGVCFHDVLTRNGTVKAGVQMPMIPGHEIAGTVAEIGAEVRGLRIGDRVATTQRRHVCGNCRYCRTAREPLCDEAVFIGDAGLNGGFAEFVSVEVDNVAVVPESVPLDAAAIASCALGTMFHAVREVGRVQLGESVLVTGGGGGLGIHGIQIAHAAGAFVIAHTTSSEKVDAIRAAGAHEVVLSERGGDFAKIVRMLTGGEGVDIVIDNVGSPVFQPTRRSLRRGGRWVLVGQVTGEFIPFNPAQLFLKSVSMLSATSTTREELRRTLDLIARGVVRPIVSDAVPLEGAAEAHEKVEKGRVLGRIVVEPAA